MAIEISHEMHMQGLAAFSGAETALLQARISIAEIETELERARREATIRGCDTRDLTNALKLLRDLSKDLLARRACLMELHRDFRGMDDELTPVRPSSDSALAAFRSSSNFPKGRP